MNEPVRLREGRSPGAALLRGAKLEVPVASRQRALTFASTLTAGVVATSTATATAAGATSLAKSFLVYLAVGAAGGGALSLAASTVVSQLDAPPATIVAPAKRVPAPSQPRASAAALAIPVEPVPAPLESEPAENGAGLAQAPLADMPRPSTSDARRPPPAASLFEEQRAIEKARSALSRGDAATGLRLLDDYERGYARPQFGSEALALRVEALRHQGQLAAARARASEFERRYPRHPLLARVRELAR